MTDYDGTDELDEFIHAYISYLDGDAARPPVEALPAHLRAEATARARLLDASWGALAADLPENDPIATRFGFDQPADTVPIAGAALRRARKKANLDLAQLAEATGGAGIRVSSYELLEIESSDVTRVKGDLAATLVAVLGAPITDLEPASPRRANLGPRLESPWFSELVDDWARSHDRDPGWARNEARRRLLATQFRADDVDDEQLREILAAILHTLGP
jgi:transcriptional regulator with XRE-family HTH domain